MPTVLQQIWSPMERAFAARETERARATIDDDIELGCESACPWLQCEGWEPLDVPRAPSAGTAY